MSSILSRLNPFLLCASKACKLRSYGPRIVSSATVKIYSFKVRVHAEFLAICECMYWMLNSEKRKPLIYFEDAFYCADVVVLNSAKVRDLKQAVTKYVNTKEESQLGHRHISW